MATLSELTTQRDALEKARASGASRVSYDGRSIEYRSIDELNRALDSVKQQIATAEGSKRVRGVYVRPVKGW